MLMPASIKMLHHPAAMKNGNLEMALKAANKAAGNHHQRLPVRIILSAKKRNQMVATRQKPSVEASPAMMTIKGWVRKKAMVHQAARSPAYCRASWKNGQSPIEKKSSDTRFAQPYQLEWVSLNIKPAAACQTGNS